MTPLPALPLYKLLWYAQKSPSGKRKKLVIRAKVPWDHYTDIYPGVIQPLQRVSDQLSITIEIEAEGEIDENTVNLKIRETLKQIGAEIERFEWR